LSIGGNGGWDFSWWCCYQLGLNVPLLHGDTFNAWPKVKSGIEDNWLTGVVVEDALVSIPEGTADIIVGDRIHTGDWCG
jgi:hypothetical protein